MKPPNSALPPDALPQADRISEFRLVRYFTATSLVAFVVVAAVLGYVFRQFSINGLLRAQEEANVNLTRVFSNGLWRNDFGPFVRAMEGKPPAELKAAPQIPQLHRKVLALMRGSSTFKVKVYDMKGMTVYSTELKQIGEDKSGNLGVIAAWQGATTSELVHRNTFSALEGEVQNRDLIQSYIPQNDPETGKVIGVFEVYSDVTSLLGEIGEKQWYVMGAVFGMMALLYAALFLIVNFAQRIMDQQRQAHDRAEEALRNSELSRSKSQFLAAAAHELRTPMTSIFGFSELLRTRSFDRATELDVVESIHNEAGRLVHLLNKLLDLSRIEERAGQAFDFELQPLVPIIETSIVELLVPGDGRKVQTDIEQHLPPLLLDRDKIKQAMINILSNAYKYSPRDTSIELKVFRDSASGRQRVGVRITDHGMGMSAAEQAHVFERFWRADNAKAVPGSGLGMALVKEIISFHQGTIEIRSEPGAGTQVTLWFPADEQSEEAIAC